MAQAADLGSAAAASVVADATRAISISGSTTGDRTRRAAGLWPTLGGTSKSNAWDIPVGYTFAYKGLMHSLSVHFNRQERTGINLYAFTQDIAGEAGLLGVSTAPFDWGVPSLSFSSISSVRDTTPSTRTDQTFSIGDSIVKTVGHHALRFGADYRHVGFDSRSDTNPRGSYVFTGLYYGPGPRRLPAGAAAAGDGAVRRRRQHIQRVVV